MLCSTASDGSPPTNEFRSTIARIAWKTSTRRRLPIKPKEDIAPQLQQFAVAMTARKTDKTAQTQGMNFTTPLATALLRLRTLIVRADNKHQDHILWSKPIHSKSAVVSDDKLGEHGKPCVFLRKGTKSNSAARTVERFLKISQIHVRMLRRRRKVGIGVLEQSTRVWGRAGAKHVLSLPQPRVALPADATASALGGSFGPSV